MYEAGCFIPNREGLEGGGRRKSCVDCLFYLAERDNEEVCALTHLEMNKNRYVIAVGWDKTINIYSDSSEEGVRQVQHPQPRWPDDRVSDQGAQGG